MKWTKERKKKAMATRRANQAARNLETQKPPELPSVEEAHEASAQIQEVLSPGAMLSPVGILVALHGYSQLFYKGNNISDIDHTMLDVHTGTTWYAKPDYKKSVVFLQRKPRVGEVTFYELDEDWFKNLGAVKMPEVYFDPELQAYIPMP